MSQFQRQLLKVALTGGIATGKSHVLARLAERGIPTIDADQLARVAVGPGAPAWTAIRARFGPEVLLPDGAVDRHKLARVIFADSNARRDLEAIVHPEVYRAIRQWFAELMDRGQHRLAVAGIPLLYETGHAGDFDRVIVVACDPQTQVARLKARDGLAEDEALRRLAAQSPIGDKVARADFVIRTNGAFDDTDRQVEDVHQELLREVSRPRQD